MKYAYIFDGTKHYLAEFEDDAVIPDYPSFVVLDKDKYEYLKNVDVTKYHLEWDNNNKPVLVEYGKQQWIEIKDGKIVSSAGYRFSETCVKAEKPVVRGYDGGMYYEDDLPEKPVEAKQIEVRAVRNQYLEQTDKYMISDFPVSKVEKADYKAYRQYLRDYTEQEEWWTHKPLTFEEWKDEQ